MRDRVAEAFDPVRFLRQHGVCTEDGLRAERLSGGYLNAVFRVRGDGLDWVVKRFAVDQPPSLYPNLPEAEHLALQRLSPIHAAPRPVAFIAGEAPVLVYEFFAGEEWSGDLAAVAGLLRRIRGVDTSGFRSVPMRPQDILEQAEIFVAHCSAEFQSRLRAARPAPVEIPGVARGVIHTDLGPGNLIAGAQGLVAIDWQCPAAGDPVEDLAAFLSPAFQILYGRVPLSVAEEQELLSLYGDDAAVARLRLLRPFFDWRMAAYCAMRAEQYAAKRPEAAARYRKANAALFARLETKE
jgi:thiamine kinase-like enzyme